MARPSKYTPEAVERIVEALEQGATYEAAAAHAGVHYDTLNEWRKEFPEFSEALKGAEAKAELHWLEQIEAAAADGAWQAAAWRLERRYPARWGRRERVERVDMTTTVRREAERVAAEVGCTADELIAEAERIAARIARDDGDE
jgi:transposase